MSSVVIGPCTLYCGDSREILPTLPLVDAIIADPPYGDTSLEWDQRVNGWLEVARGTLQPHGSLWCWGSLGLFMDCADAFAMALWRRVQDVIWEKHNASNMANDRFKRVHEHAVQFIPRGVKWEDIYKCPQTTPDAARRTVRRKRRPPQWGYIEAGHYESVDGGPRLMRSVIYARSCHGYAIHPTQKPVDVLMPLIEYSVPPGGLVADWFMGSGSLAVAAIRSGRRYIGCEIDPQMFERACAYVSREYRNPYGVQVTLPWEAAEA